ncbi:hypothetical protein ACQ86G_10435 [Roseateles chitinivorans]|uniref:hypothetical protein n=1 Tax=Roseateles chitinivorans TaxID=2917965 RepID=UPI003D66ACE2
MQPVDRSRNGSPELPPSAGKVASSTALVDYGQFVLMAAGAPTPESSKRALDILNSCETANKLNASLERARGGNKIHSEKLAALLGDAQQLQRSCQSITADMYAYRAQFAQAALLGAMPGAAVAYGTVVDFKPPAEMRIHLLNGLRAESAAGSYGAIVSLALHGAELGVSNVEMQAVRDVIERLDSSAQNEMLKSILDVRRPLELSQQENDQAKRLADRLEAALRARSDARKARSAG